MIDIGIWGWISALTQSGAETFLLLNIYSAFLGKPKMNKHLAYACIALAALLYCVFLNIIVMPAHFRYTLSTAIFLLYSLAWSGSFWKRIFALCVDLALNVIVSTIVYWLIELIRTNREVSLSIDSVLFVTPNVLLLVTIAVLFHYFYSSVWEQLKITSIQWLMIAFLPCISFLITLSLFSIPVQDPGKHLLLIIDAVGLLVAMIIHFFLINYLYEHNQKEELQQLLQQKMQLESEKANALYDVYMQQRRLTHDFTNQLNTIAGLLERGNTQSALELIHSSSSTIQENTLVVNTGQPMIDTLLSQKYNEAKKKSIPIIFSLCNLKECPISSTDLLVLLGNLIDNAIEASEKIDTPCVQIKLQLSNRDFVISVRNRTNHSAAILNNVIPASTKTNIGHGIGLKNVVSILQKYHTDYTVTSKQGWFQFTALTCCE